MDAYRGLVSYEKEYQGSIETKRAILDIPLFKSTTKLPALTILQLESHFLSQIRSPFPSFLRMINLRAEGIARTLLVLAP